MDLLKAACQSPTSTSLTANQQFSYLVCVLHSLRLPSMCLTGFCDTIKSLSPQYHYQHSFKNPDLHWPRRLKQHRQPPPPRYINSLTKCWPSLNICNKSADVEQPRRSPGLEVEHSLVSVSSSWRLESTFLSVTSALVLRLGRPQPMHLFYGLAGLRLCTSFTAW